ncbi:hypothetical protein E2Q31_07015 [Salmonella enterica subsp. enterica serovar Oranienburg]|nr:hypothetical protein [Salmonella enterica]EBR9058840.1 hypothetical protein [Salmonella enterica subsp. enterica serovar Koketime]EBU8757157.1 hypothetical protein [Salmonella enterica subsp. enterica serovar Offa]EBV0858347.1 hypothetical protein [Salmonella enterica subsp. enterica serovar Anecho]EBY1133250.1 hypothetical protein [Salmonella enterica subsp. enterica serovar Senftenberg]ECA0738201.1 hypothetical protein [Salmonella enterica subsp. enterica serovar Adelaide]ECD6377920.1 hy
MYAPIKEIMTDLLKYDMAPEEALLVLCITREDIRMLTTEWNMSDEDITCVMQRLYAVAEEGGGDADAFLAEEIDAMRQLQTAIDG